MTDPIADMLTRIRNASAIGSQTVSIPHSRLKEAIAKVLKNEGYIVDYRLEDTSVNQPNIIVSLKYLGNQPAITNLQRVSKPGRRVYVKAKNIKPVLSGYGLTLISTNQGVVTGTKARKQQLGGEVICRIW